MITSTVAALALFASVVAAQTKPDFVGRRASDPEPAGRGGQRGDVGSGWGSTITVTQDATLLTVEYAFFSRGDMQPPLKFMYALNGAKSPTSPTCG